MPVIHLNGLTPDSAEKVIARIWYVLEERNIESPRIDTCRRCENRVDIEFTFQAQRDADAIRIALQGLWSLVAQAPTPMPR